jgi:small-conductance mechanosensitive channel
VIVENESGNIEEITFSYVVVRLWDFRRMIVPLSYFIEKPFQNWTRVGGDLIGSVFLYVDHVAPVETIRKKLNDVVLQSKLWNGKVVRLQVSDCKETTIELRALVSADNASAAWDLRCEVREKLIEFIQREHPYALPRRRLEDVDKTAARSDEARDVRAARGLTYHHRCGLNRPAARSITSPSANKVSSSNGRPINCRPSGNP